MQKALVEFFAEDLLRRDCLLLANARDGGDA